MSLAAFAILAFVGESLVEYIFQGPLDVGEWKKYIGLGVGVGLAWAFGADMFQAMFGMQALHPTVGITLTGFVVGRGSNFVHDLHDTYFENRKREGD